MKTLMRGLLVTCTLLGVASLSLGATGVKVSQVYGGGGGSSTSATYNQDYVELFNSSGTAVDISGWALEYGSATGNWGSSVTNYFVFPANTSIPPCAYLLVACGTVGTGSPNIPLTPDFTGTMNLSATNGKIGLFNAVNANIPCGSELAGTVVDKVAYGTANCAEGTAVAALSVSTGAVRNGAGTTDSDNNVADFTVVSGPVPRNSGSPSNPGCSTSPVLPASWGAVKSLYR